ILSQKASDPGNTRIVGDLEKYAISLIHMHDGCAKVICIPYHGAKFKAAENAPLLADTFCGIEYRPLGFQLHGYGDGQDARGKHDQCQQGQCDIEDTLHPEAEFGRAAAVKRNGGKPTDELDWIV